MALKIIFRDTNIDSLKTVRSLVWVWVADLWSAPSFVFLKKSQGSSREHFLGLLSACEDNSENSSWTPVTMWGASSGSESIEWRDWQTEGPTSGWGSSWERSSGGFWFSTFVFRNVPGTFTECVRICGFKRKSSNLDRAPKMRESVLLNFWDSFLATLPSISSETCVIYSSLFLGTDVFRDWPFLRCSSYVSLVTAANFRLFLNVAIFLKGKCYAVIKTEFVFIC